MPGIFDEALTFGPRSPRRRETVCIFPDDVPTRAMSPHKSASTDIPVYTMNKTPLTQTKRQRKPMQSASAPRAPLQRNLKPPQPRASTRDIPGRGGGKENVPPGMSTYSPTKSKPTGIPIYQMNRRAEHNITPTQVTQRRPRQLRKESSDRIAVDGVGIDTPKAPKSCQTVAIKPQASRACLQPHQTLHSIDVATLAIEVVRAYCLLVENTDHRGQRARTSHSAVASNPSNPTAFLPSMCSTSERDQSAVAIQRAWRSYVERRRVKEQEASESKAKVDWAAQVIIRWWCGLKGNQSPEHVPRRKVVARRSTARQSRGRMGIRRL